MRTAIAFLFLLLPGVSSARQDLQSYTPERTIDAPTFINAEVVRVNRDNTATFRSESGEITLTAAEGSAPGMLEALHAGDKVLVEYRETRDAAGRVTRFVTSVKPASPASGEPGRGRAVAARLTAGSTVRARVLSYDTRRRRVTVIDESGGLRLLPLRSGLTGLDVLGPGANVAFTLGAARGGVVNVTRIASLGSTPVFASGNAFPTVSGEFVSFDRSTSLVTIDTATAGRVTFPVATSAAGGFTGLTRGDTLGVAFDVTSGQPAVITGFQPVTAVGSAAIVPAVLPAGTVSGQPVAVAPATDTGATGTVAVVPGAAARDRSPFVSTVPSIPAAPPAPGVVLPAAGAKDPLSANDVGMMRAQGERDLDAAAVALAAAAAAIDPVWAGFKNQCLSGFTVNTPTSGREWYLLADDRVPTPNDDGCRALHADLTGRVRGFLSQVETVEDAARKADVLPVRVREVFDRHKLR
jgi:hypothetical protein